MIADAISMSEHSSEYPLSSLMKAWRGKIARARKVKREKFGEAAEELMKFYECGKEFHNAMWESKSRVSSGPPDMEELPAPYFRMVVGKVAEFVALYGPSLYHRNPAIVVEPKTPDIPNDLLMQLADPMLVQQAVQAAQQQGQQFSPDTLFPPDPNEPRAKVVSMLLQYMLDYLQRENDKKTHSQQAIDEALIKGASVLFTTILQNYTGGSKLAGSVYRSINDILIDPDAETWDEVTWIGISWCKPCWEVAEEFGQSEDYLLKKYGSLESIDQQESIREDKDGKDKQRKGITNDLMEYVEIFSKMGMGHRLSGIRTQHNPHGLLSEELVELLDHFGKYNRIVVAEKVPYPLNLNNDLILELLTKPEDEPETDDEAPDQPEPESPEREELFMRAQWPIPFWADGDWPITMLGFRFVPGSIWPGPCLKPALGYLKFLNWTMSFMANRIRHSCRTVIGVMKSAEEEIKQRLLSGKDFEILEVPSMNAPDGDVNKFAHFFQIPDVPGEVWKIVDWVSHEFDKASGLTELMYAAPGGMRSAAEANVKQASLQIRPDDMASKVEDWASSVARKEAIALHWLDEADVAYVLGQRCSALWEEFVRALPFESIFREYNYRVEAGSTRKPNKDTQKQQITQLGQAYQPFINTSLQQGNVGPANAFMSEMAAAFDFDPKPFLLQPPPPPPPNPMQQKIEAEIEGNKQELALKGQEMQMNAQMKQAELQLKAQETGIKLQGEQARMQMDAAQTAQQMELERTKSLQGLQIEGMKAAVGIKQQQSQMVMSGLQAAHDARLKTMQMAMDAKLKKQQANKKPATNGKAK